MNASTVKQEVKNITDELISIRRYLHQNPELSFQEIKTSKYISELLNKWGIEHTSNVGGYGIIGILKGKNPDSKVIALRADMDALPIIEENNVKYCSVNDGVMHACGHDVHMTCLLGTIKLLSENRDWFNGSIKFIFQPAEETLPGGALKMIEDGVLENPKPDLIIGQHVFPELESGKVGVRSGPYMASTDELNLTISGRGGHGALPQTFDDTIHTAAELIHKIKEKVNEKAPTDYPTVLSFGKIVADGAYNIIPKEVIIKGTFRTFDENWRKIVHKIIKTIATEISAKHNTNCDVFINSGYPVLENDKQLAILFEKNAIEYLGEQNVEILDMRTTGEDFARFTQLIPGVFYRLGIANKKQGINSRLHSPTFDIDESSIEIGTGIMIWNTIMTSLDDSY
ncbi:MAG: amidohydrolase [Lentimicrobiaceae bacterium]|jgi:amidohydrolase|nr:amidohydrolase [Lentimicrobiaceae bacterium]MBT3455235.1 amidohydrolase [Lentimicrobiaceae bacterium]MBT4061410.1 amidohydrolase [Lentimicrobiaceae bacterium]MBT4468647.1 amidohydrolase [Lentimicrobiaceae bacterium]MBT4800126.1 amidohydrolase [Lentimicrobiaceae bacterium]